MVHAQAPESQTCSSLHAALQSQARLCECAAAAYLHRSPGPGRCAWGDARGAFVRAFTAALSSSVSIWVRAHGAAPAGVGEVTL